MHLVAIIASMSMTKMAAPSLSDYRNFHGMHIGVPAARRCVQSFQRGTIIFSPATYIDSMATTFPDSGTSPYEVHSLTLTKYYFLVLSTLTGLSTLLGLTDVMDATECTGTDAKALDHPLHPSPPLLAYLERRCGGAVTLARRFEYRFRLVGLQVIMLHYRSDDGRLHLVEVYKSAMHLLWPWLGLMAAVLATVFRVLL